MDILANTLNIQGNTHTLGPMDTSANIQTPDLISGHTVPIFI